MKHIFSPKIAPLLLLLGVWLGIGCVEQQVQCTDPTNRSCPNFDPCLVTPAANSSFVVIDTVYGNQAADTTLSFVVDTVKTGENLTFRANTKRMASYEWKIGSDPQVFTEPVFELYFFDFIGPVSIRLVTTAQDEYACLRPDELTDTSYYQVEIIDLGPYESPVFGKFRGTSTANPTESYEVEVLGEGEDLWHSFRLFNLQTPCLDEYPIGIRLGFGYDWFVSSHSSSFDRCRNIVVVGQLSEDKRTLTIAYTYDADDGKRVHEVFTGQRI